MFFYPCPPCPSAGPTVRIRSVLVLSSFLPLWLQTTNAARIGPVEPPANAPAPAEHSSSSSSTTSNLPPIVIICIIATGVFFIALGSISLFLYIRRLRERTKRNEHREKAWQFKDMQKNGLRPTLQTEPQGGGLSSSTGNTPIQISEPVLMTEAASSPRYPTRAFRW